MEMKYNSKMICKICEKEIAVNDAKVEWLIDVHDKFNLKDIYLCHKECSAGYNSAKALVGDFDLNLYIYKEEYVFSRLNEMKEQYPYLSNDISEIILKLFI
ncbi:MULTISPECIES: hypothetical protein [unclassified Clostridium]|uniref:hypothetical protein n=1 Tax=unclassified Clostridium TaxID=2614128 RepID=UPI003217C099